VRQAYIKQVVDYECFFYLQGYNDGFMVKRGYGSWAIPAYEAGSIQRVSSCEYLYL